MPNPPEFERLVDAHYAALYRFGYALTHSGSEAEDLTQQTFYRWATKGDQLRDPAQAKTWLFTTLYREFLATVRRKDHYPAPDSGTVWEDSLAEEAPAPGTFDSRMLLEALALLDEKYRAPITLFYLRDFPYRRIAEVLGIPAGTVMSRLARGKAELRRLLLQREKECASRVLAFPSPAAGPSSHE